MVCIYVVSCCLANFYLSITFTLLLIAHWVVILEVFIFLWMFQHLSAILITSLVTWILSDPSITNIFLLRMLVGIARIGQHCLVDPMACRRRGYGCYVFWLCIFICFHCCIFLMYLYEGLSQTLYVLAGWLWWQTWMFMCVSEVLYYFS